jgi:hypothetical protein
MIVALFIFGRGGPKQVSTAPELSGPGTVIIDNTDRLSEILLPEQYQALSNALAVYIQVNVDPKIVHATIVGQPSVAANASVSFTLKTDKPSVSLDVSVDRSNFDKLIMTIPAKSYSQVIPVFTSPEGE